MEMGAEKCRKNEMAEQLGGHTRKMVKRGRK